MASAAEQARLRSPRPLRAQAVLHMPDARPKRTGVLVMHAQMSYLDHIACRELTARGYPCLGVDPPLPPPWDWHELPAYTALGVQHLCASGLVDRVVLLGHSGGGPLMVYYESLAEAGQFPAADGVVLLDTHLGGAFAIVTYVDPAYDPTTYRRDPELDLFDERNGYTPGGTHYSDAFRRRFHQAQAQRYRALVADARDRLAHIEAGRGRYADDEPFDLHGLTPRIWFNDRRLLSRTHARRALLHPDGSCTTGIVPSVRPLLGTEGARHAFGAACMQQSVRQFLSWNAIEVSDEFYVGEDAIAGVDWSTSLTSTVANAGGLHVPLLVMPMSAHYFLAPDELIYQAAPSQDKELVCVEGAQHAFTPVSSEYGDTIRTTFDYVAQWLATRFG
ncbi:MAG: hypothetical protein JO247_06440 [Chloroflexi bacterium]|nr:hypothetical protein [Chloroflexota bacterium]